jgi:hypothetical protein
MVSWQPCPYVTYALPSRDKTPAYSHCFLPCLPACLLPACLPAWPASLPLAQCQCRIHNQSSTLDDDSVARWLKSGRAREKINKSKSCLPYVRAPLTDVPTEKQLLACCGLFAFGRQQSCPPKALKALFDPPTRLY